MTKKKLLIVAKEITIPLAAKVYDEVLIEKKEFDPVIFLITPVEEIIDPRFIRKYFKKRKYIPSWRSLKIIMEKNDSINQIKQIDLDTYKLIKKQLCSEPSQLFDLNRKTQFINHSSYSLKFVLCSQALHFHNILSTYKDSLIIDFDIYSVNRTILLNVSKFYGIEYRTMIRSRFDNYYFRSNSLGKDIAKKMLGLNIENKYLSEAKNELKNFRDKCDITTEVEKTVLINKFSLKATLFLFKFTLLSFYLMAYRILRESILFFNYPVSRKHKKYIIGNIIPNHLNIFIAKFRGFIRTWLPYQDLSSLPEEYIYFPMPNTIENSEVRFNGNILSERLVIDLFRASIGLIPMICKDHRSMVQDRTFDFAKEISNINNIIYVSEWKNKWDLVNPLRLLKESTLNITIAGTAGLESAMLGKPTLILGEPIYGEFFRLSGSNLFNMKEISEALQNDNFPKNQFIIDEKIIIRYLAATINLGVKMNLFFLIEDPFNPKFKNEIRKLINFLI